MIALIGDHLWESTLFAAAAALLAAGLRAHRAEIRFGIWLAASVKFLVPFAALAAIGAEAGARWAPPIADPQVAMVIDAVGQPFAPSVAPSGQAVGASDAAGLAGGVAPAVFAVWACGFLAVLGAWWIRWRRVRATARAGTVLTSGRELDILRRSGIGVTLVSCDGPLEPGVFGIVRPVLLWPRGISERLNDDQVAAILAHEMAHLRRRDNLAAALHMLVQALFWFYPVVWWIGGRLVHERERACDEAVLHSGGEPETYAESILKTCEYCIEAPLACVSGVTGADLTRRIEAIMSSRPAVSLGPTKRFLLFAGAAAVFAGPVLAGGLHARPRQADAQGAGEKLTFEVASIKPNDSGEGRVMMRFLPGGAYEAINVTMRALIQQAYRMSERQVIGGPAWLETARFDILAKSPQGAVQAQFLDRMQALLVERLNLQTHRETREMPIYALVLARSDGGLGPQIRKSPVDCTPGAAPSGRGRGDAPPPAVAGAGGRQQMPFPSMPPLGSEPRPCGLMMGGNRISGGGTTMAALANTLQNNTGRIVQDRTGLSGSFDFDLEFTPDPALRGRGPGGGLPPRPGDPAPAADPDSVSIFTAVQEQLGLRLESATGPVEVLVIDRVEPPTEN